MRRTGSLSLHRVTSAIGATIDGVDLCERLPPETVRFLRQALTEHGVIFFHDQDLGADQMKAFVSNFGKPVVQQFSSDKHRYADPVAQANVESVKHATAVWHADTTFAAEPPMATALRAVKPPPVGGDTCWSSMYAAYEALSEPMRNMLGGLTAVHSMEPVIKRMGDAAEDYAESTRKLHGSENLHPVVRVHPETGRKALYVNEGWTARIVELTPAESAHLLALLFEHVKSPDFTMRWHWTANDVAFWDNRCVQHYAVPDYSSERIMQRVVIAGDRPFGPTPKIAATMDAKATAGH
jgi:taurine dioxygenase